MDFMPSVLPVFFQPTIFLLTLHAPENKLMPRALPLSATCDVVNKACQCLQKNTRNARRLMLRVLLLGATYVVTIQPHTNKV